MEEKKQIVNPKEQAEQSGQIQNTQINWEELFLKGWHPYAWVIAVGFLIYAQTLWFDFSYLDDDVLIINKGIFFRDSSTPAQNNNPDFTSSVIQSFNKAYCNMYYRPVLIISFLIDYYIGKAINPTGFSPGIYHFTNIILHLIACCLLFLFLVKMKYRKDLSFLFSIIFAVHPVLTQAVAWIPGRNDELLTIFSILTFIFLLKFIETKQWKHYGLCVFFFAVSLFTKESALILIPMILLYLYIINKDKIFSLANISFVLGWMIVIIVFFFLRHPTIKVAPDFTIFVMLKVMWANLPQIILFIGKSIFPMELSVAPLVQDSSFVYGAITIILALFSLIISKNVRYRFVLFGLFWFLISHIPPIMTVVAMEQRMHFAIIGFIIVLMEFDFIKNINFNKDYALIILVGVFIAYSGVTFTHSRNTYKNKITFWENAARMSPHSPLSQRSIAEMYYMEWKEGKRDNGLEEAEKKLYEAIALREDQPEAHNYLGLIHMDKGFMLEQYAQQLKAEGKMKEADEKVKESGLLLAQSEKEYKRAIEIYKDMYIKARESSSIYHDAYLNLGGLYYRSGKMKEAEETWKTTIQANPYKTQVYNNIGLVYMGRGITALEESRKLREQAKLSQSEAKQSESANQFKTAEEFFKRELSINPDYDKAYFNLGMLYSHQGNQEAAEMMWLNAIKTNPKQALNVYQNMVMYFKVQKNYIKFWYYINQLQKMGVPIPAEVTQDVPRQ
jgi:tetratricopeptide (TPR) repeat protein